MQATTRTASVQTLRDHLSQGFEIQDVSSTDDHLLLWLNNGRDEVELALDRQATSQLFGNPRLIQQVPLSI